MGCSVEGCDRPHYGLGYCRLHYRRFKKHGEPGGLEPQWTPIGGVCEVEGCDRLFFSRGLCTMHHQRWRKYGDPGEPIRRIGSGDDISYGATHMRIWRTKGPASVHSCVDCGRPAQDWSYQGGSPKERMGSKDHGHGVVSVMAYSPDPNDYEPRCRSCHKEHDRRG